MQMGHRTILSVPMLRENESIGAIVLRRLEVQPFTDKQIDLLKTFADQAVIAIENVRLFDEVQAKTRDLEEALQFQTASAEVLKVISRSPDALQPVLDVIVATSRELCSAISSVIFLFRDGKFQVAAEANPQAEYVNFVRSIPFCPTKSDRRLPAPRGNGARSMSPIQRRIPSTGWVALWIRVDRGRCFRCP